MCPQTFDYIITDLYFDCKCVIPVLACFCRAAAGFSLFLPGIRHELFLPGTWPLPFGGRERKQNYIKEYLKKNINPYGFS